MLHSSDGVSQLPSDCQEGLDVFRGELVTDYDFFVSKLDHLFILHKKPITATGRELFCL